jgi:type IV pilus assembly protein PilM
MFKKFKSKPLKSFIGLDIGKFSVKIVEFTFDNERILLKNILNAGLSFETIVDDLIISTNEIIDRTSELIKLYKLNSKKTAISIPGNSAIIKRLEVGGNTYDEIHRNVLNEAPNHIPYNITEVEVTFFIENEESESEKREVFLVAVKKEILDDYLSILINSGLRPEIADIDFFALQNIFEFNYSDEINPEELVAIIDIGTNITNIIVLKDFKSLFYRDSAISNYIQYTRIMDDLNFSFEKIEKLRISRDKNIKIKNFSDKLEKTILNEITKGVDLFLNSNNVDKIDKIYLSGGGSLNSNIFLKLKEIYRKSEIFYLDPFKKIEIDSELFDIDYINYIKPQFSVAAGLALRGLDD